MYLRTIEALFEKSRDTVPLTLNHFNLLMKGLQEEFVFPLQKELTISWHWGVQKSLNLILQAHAVNFFLLFSTIPTIIRISLSDFM